MSSMINPRNELTHLSNLIDSIYSCITDPARWGPVIPAVAQWVNAPRAILYTPFHTPAKGGFYFNAGIPPAIMELWNTRYHDQDPWAAHGTRLGLYKEGIIFNGDRYVPYEELIKTAFYQEFLVKQDTAHILAGIVYGEDSPGGMPAVVSSFHRGVRQGKFIRREEHRLQILMPHLSRSLGVMHRLRDAELKVASSLAALEQLTTGVLLISAGQQVVHANRAARRLLDQEDGLCLQPVCGRPSEDRLIVNHPPTAESVRAAVREAVAPDLMASTHFSRSVAVARPSGRPSYVLNFSPLPRDNEFGSGSAIPRAIVFLTGGDEPVQIDAALWRKTYRLTKAEIRVLGLIAEGTDQEQTTGRLGISANTLKSHLRSIYAKTGVSCRSQLMKRVYSLCGRVG